MIDKEQIRVTVLVLTCILLLSFFVSAGIVWVVCWAFHWTFSWGISIACWLLWLVLNGVMKKG